MRASFPRTATCRLLLASALAVTLPGFTAAQDTNCRRRKVLVHAMDKRGQTIPGLMDLNFKAEFRGKPVQIVSVRPFKAAPRIVIVLDSSGSMQDVWAHAGVIATHVAMAFRDDQRIALVIFNNQVTHEKGFRTPREDILYLLRALQRSEGKTSSVKGRTALYLALLRAVEILRPAQPGDVIYLISDGSTDNRSGIDYLRVERTFLAAGVRFFTTAVSDPYSGRRSPEEIEGPAKLKQLGEVTGGSFLSVLPFSSSHTKPSEAEKELTDLLYLLYRHMAEPYEIEIELPIDVDRARGWDLELKPPPGVKKSGTQLLYPQKLLPCTQP